MTPQDQIGPNLDDYADEQGNVSLDNYEKYLATKHRVPLELAKAIRRGESGGGGHYGGKGGSVITSPTAGARGRYQVLPTTAKALGITNLDDPAENTRAGILELRRLHDIASKHTDNDEDRWIYATAGYFGGEGNLNRVAKTGQMDRADTKLDKQGRVVRGTSTFDYVQNVIDRTKELRAAGEGSSPDEGISNFFTGPPRQGGPEAQAPQQAAGITPQQQAAARRLRGQALPGGDVRVPYEKTVYDYDITPPSPQRKGKGSVFDTPAPPKDNKYDVFNPGVRRGGIYMGTPEQEAEVKSGRAQVSQLSQALKGLRPVDTLKAERAKQQAEAQKHIDDIKRKAAANRLGIAPPKGPTLQVPSGEAANRAYGQPGVAPQDIRPERLPQKTIYQGFEPPAQYKPSFGQTVRDYSGLSALKRADEFTKAIEDQAKHEVSPAFEAGQLEGQARDQQMIMNSALLHTVGHREGGEWGSADQKKRYDDAKKERDRLNAQAHLKAVEADHLGYFGEVVRGGSGVLRDIPSMAAAGWAGSKVGGLAGSVVPGAGTAVGGTIGGLAGAAGALGMRQDWEEHPYQSAWEVATVPMGFGAGAIASRALPRMLPSLLKGPLRKYAPMIGGMLGGAVEEGVPAGVVEYIQSGNLRQAVRAGSQEAVLGTFLGGGAGAKYGQLPPLVPGKDAYGPPTPEPGQGPVYGPPTPNVTEQQIAQLSQAPPGETQPEQVERERKLAILDAQRRRAADRSGSYIAPVGEPGVGRVYGPPTPPPGAPPPTAPPAAPAPAAPPAHPEEYGMTPYAGPPGLAAWAPQPRYGQGAYAGPPGPEAWKRPEAPEGEPTPYEFRGRGADFLLKPEELAELDQVMAAPEFGKSNKLVNIDEQAQVVRDLWQQIGRSSQANVGASPEILGALVKLGVGYAEAGIRAFPQWSAAMIKKAQELELPVSWLRSELRGIYSRMGKELGVDLTPPEQVAQQAEQWELPEGDELGLGGMVKRRQPKPVAQPEAVAPEAEARGRVSRPGDRPEQDAYGHLAERLSDDLPFYGGGRIDRSVSLDPDVRSAVASGLADMRERGIEPTDSSGRSLNITPLNMRVPWETEPIEYEAQGKRQVPIYDTATKQQRDIGGRALQETHSGLKALIAERLSGQADITSLRQVTPEDYVDWFNDNIPPTSGAWGKLRNAIEAAGLKWPENARKGVYAPEPLSQLPVELDPTPELSDALQGDNSPLSHQIRQVVGASTERFKAFGQVYSNIARAHATTHRIYAKGEHYAGRRAEPVTYPDKNGLIVQALQAVHEAGGDMEEAAELGPALGRWDTPTGTSTLLNLRRLKTPESQSVYQAMLGVANSPSPKIDPTGVVLTAINKWLDYHGLKSKRQAGTLEKWLTNKRNAGLRQGDRSLIQIVDHYTSTGDSAGLAGFMQAMYEVQAIDPKASQEDAVNAAATIQRENELEEQGKGKKTGGVPPGGLPFEEGGAPTGVTQTQPGAQTAAQAAAARQQTQAQATPIGPQRPVVYAKRDRYANISTAARLAVFRSEIKQMDGGQLERLVTQLGQVEQTPDNTVRLEAAQAELAKRQAAEKKFQGPTLKQQRQKAEPPRDFAGNEVKVPALTFIRQMGGISLISKVTGDYHAGGSEIKDVIDTARSGGLINEKTGRTPEDVFENLLEAGYLPPDTEFNDFLEWIHKTWQNRKQAKPQTVSDEEQLEREAFPREILQMSASELVDLDRQLKEAQQVKGQDKAHISWLSEQRSLIKQELTRRRDAMQQREAQYNARVEELQGTIKSLKRGPKGESPNQKAERMARGAIAVHELELERLEFGNFKAELEGNQEVQDDLAGRILMAGIDLAAAQETLDNLQKVQTAEPEVVAEPVVEEPRPRKKRTRATKAAQDAADRQEKPTEPETPVEDRETPRERRETEAARRAAEIHARPLDVNELAELDEKLKDPAFFDKNTLVDGNKALDEAKELFGYKSDLENIGTRAFQMYWVLTKLGVAVVEAGVRKFPEWSAAMIRKAEEIGIENMAWFRSQLYSLYRTTMAYPGLSEGLTEKLQAESDKRLRKIEELRTEIAKGDLGQSGEAATEARLRAKIRALEANLGQGPSAETLAGPSRHAPLLMRRHLERDLKIAQTALEEHLGRVGDPVARLEKHVDDTRRRIDQVEDSLEKLAIPEPEPPAVEAPDPEEDARNIERALQQVRASLWRASRYSTEDQVVREMSGYGYDYNAETGEYSVRREAPVLEKFGPPHSAFRQAELRVELEGLRADLDTYELDLRKLKAETPAAPYGGLEGILQELEASHEQQLAEGFTPLEEAKAFSLKWNQPGLYEGEVRTDEVHAEIMRRFEEERQKRNEEYAALRGSIWREGYVGKIMSAKEARERAEQREAFAPGQKAYEEELRTWKRKLKEVQKRGVTEEQFERAFPRPVAPDLSAETHIGRVLIRKPEESDVSYQQRQEIFDGQAEVLAAMIASGEHAAKGRTLVTKKGKVIKVTPGQLSRLENQEDLFRNGYLTRMHPEHMSPAARLALLGQKEILTPEGKRKKVPEPSALAPAGMTIEEQALNQRVAFDLRDWDRARLDEDERLINAGRIEEVLDREVTEQREAATAAALKQREVAAQRRAEAGEEVAEEDDEALEPEEDTEEAEEAKEARAAEAEKAEELEKKLRGGKGVKWKITAEEYDAYKEAKDQYDRDLEVWEADQERAEEEGGITEAQFRLISPKPIRPARPRLGYMPDVKKVLAPKEQANVDALDGRMKREAESLTRLGQTLEAARFYREKVGRMADRATTREDIHKLKEGWKQFRSAEGNIMDQMGRIIRDIQLMQDEKNGILGYHVKKGAKSVNSIVKAIAAEEGVTGDDVYSALEAQDINIERDVTGLTELGPGVIAKAEEEEGLRAGLTFQRQKELGPVKELFSQSWEEMGRKGLGRSTQSKRMRAREAEAELFEGESEVEAEVSPKRTAEGAKSAFENLFKKEKSEQPTLADVSDADIQKVRRLTRERAANAPVTRVFERAEWADDIVNIGAATTEEVLAAADIQSTPELESLGSYVAQANNAGIALVELALQDLGYMSPDADGLAIPLKAVPKLAAALRNYGEAGDFLARYMEAVVRLKEKGHTIYGDRVVLVNAADHIDSQHLYDNVAHELFHLLQFDMAAELDPQGLNRGKFVVKDPDYPVLVKAMKALGENTSPANVEIEAAGYIASGDWKAMGFQSADHAKAYLKRYIRHLARTYGLQKLAKWPLMAVKGNTVAQAIREVQNEAKGAEKARQKRKETRTAAEEARVQAAAELGIELGEGARGGEGDQSGSRRVVRQLTKEQRKARYEKRRRELAKLTPAERQARRERAAELREEAKEWRESLTPEERKAAWLERRNLIKNMTPEERADYDEAREERRKTNRDLARERKGWEQEERGKEREAAQKKIAEENARKRAAEIVRNMELYGTPDNPNYKGISSTAIPPILNDPKLKPEFQPINNTEKRWWWRAAAHLWPEMGKDPMVRNGDMSALDMDEAGKGGQGGLGVGAVVDPRAGGKGWRKFAQVRQTILLASLQFWEANVGTAFTSSVYELGRAFTAELLDRMFFSRGDVTKRVVARIRPSDMWKGAIETRRMFTEAKKVGKLYTGPKRGAASRSQAGLPGMFDESPTFQMEGIPEQLVADFEELQSNWNVNTNAQRQPGETRRAWLKRRMEQAVDPGQAVKLNPAATRMEWGNVGNYLFEELLRKANQIPDIYAYSVHFLAHTAALTRMLEQKVAVRTERGIQAAEKKAGRKLTAADPEYQQALQDFKMQDWEMTEILDQAGAVALDNSMRGRNYPAMAAKGFRTAIAGLFESMVRPNAKAPYSDVLRRATNAADYVGNLSFWRIPAGMVHKAGKMVFPFSMINIGTMYWKWQWAVKKNDRQQGRFKAQFIDAISDTVMGSGAIGSVAFTLGFLGMVSGGAKDWEEEEAMKAQGIIPFAFNLTSFGRAHRMFTGGGVKAVRHVPGDVYWRPQKYAAPIALAFDMFVGGGAALQKFVDGKPQSWIDWLTAVSWQPTKAMAAALQEMTVIDRAGSDILRAASHAKTTGEWAGAIGKGVAVQTVGSALVPGQIGHLKKLTDKYEREGRGENVFEDMIGKARAKFPGASHQMPVKRDVYGQETETEPGMHWLYRFFPGNFSRYKGSPIIEAGLEAGKIPGRVHRKRAELGQPGETMTETRERGAARGQRIFNAGSVVAATEAFKKLSKANQDYVLAEIYDRAGDKEQALSIDAMLKSLDAAKKRGPGAKATHEGF